MTERAFSYAELEQISRTRRGWPEPTTDKPEMRQLEYRVFDGVYEATDGCEIEPGGVCPHGRPSRLLRLGLA